MSWYATETRVSRKERTCHSCGKPITQGQAYQRISLPPGGEIGFLGWSRWTEHIACEIPDECRERLAAIA